MRYITFVITLLIVLTGCSPIDQKSYESIQYPIQTNTSTDEKQTTKPQHTTTTQQQIEVKAEQIVEEEPTVEMTPLIVDGVRYDMPFVEGQSLYTAMSFMMTLSSRPFSFQAKEYPGLGFFVYEINGKTQDNRAGKYWIYYINDKSATIGISNYIIQQGDIIEWKYEESTF